MAFAVFSSALELPVCSIARMTDTDVTQQQQQQVLPGVKRGRQEAARAPCRVNVEARVHRL